jgi:hypothetical protein
VHRDRKATGRLNARLNAGVSLTKVGEGVAIHRSLMQIIKSMNASKQILGYQASCIGNIFKNNVGD